MSHKVIDGDGYWSWLEQDLSGEERYQFNKLWSITCFDEGEYTVSAPGSTVDDMWQMPKWCVFA